MRSIWDERMAMIDARAITLTSPGSSEVQTVEHGGQPAAKLAEMLAHSNGRPVGIFGGRISIRRLHVMLAHPWYDAVILPWQAGLREGEAWRAYACGLLAEQDVPDPEAESLCIEDAPYGRARLCIAVRHALVQDLRSAADHTGWRLASCVDATSASAGRFVKRLGSDCALVVVEPGALISLVRRQNEWQELTTLRFDFDKPLDSALVVADALSGRPTDLPALLAGFLPSHIDAVAEGRWQRLGSPGPRWDEVAI